MSTFSVRPASLAEKSVIAGMFQPYCVELARYPDDHPIPCTADGRYYSPYFDCYWQESVRFPYLLLDGAEIAGFALVRHDGEFWDLSEFYVKPAFRRRGLGRICATLIVEKHPGLLRIRFNKANRAGRALWTSLAEDLSGGRSAHVATDAFHDHVDFTAGNDTKDVS
jgi:predicted acetyltransferase